MRTEICILEKAHAPNKHAREVRAEVRGRTLIRIGIKSVLIAEQKRMRRRYQTSNLTSDNPGEKSHDRSEKFHNSSVELHNRFVEAATAQSSLFLKKMKKVTPR
ncbi:MAG: hypothetical protein HY960_02450 [Ignavibacteriae bacterium]|nr:hypothetical protein [Ignavibacteriota bacterium]